MTRITLNRTVITQLLQPDGAVEIFDEQGNIVGVFRPATEYDRAWSELDISEEEIQRRVQEPGGRTLAEIMKELEKLK